MNFTGFNKHWNDYVKIALITDTHFGARGDSSQFDDYFRKFYTEVFFPELQRRGIKTIIHTGDVFDRRKYINFNILKSCKEYFFDQLAKYKLECHMILVGCVYESFSR